MEIEKGKNSQFFVEITIMTRPPKYSSVFQYCSPRENNTRIVIKNALILNSITGSRITAFRIESLLTGAGSIGIIGPKTMVLDKRTNFIEHDLATLYVGDYPMKPLSSPGVGP